MPSFSFANEKVTFVFQGRQHWPFCDQPKERKVRRIQGNARWLYPCLVLNNCLCLHFCSSSSTLMLLVLQVIVRNAQGSDERDINVNIMGERTFLLLAGWTKSEICSFVFFNLQNEFWIGRLIRLCFPSITWIPRRQANSTIDVQSYRCVPRQCPRQLEPSRWWWRHRDHKVLPRL